MIFKTMKPEDVRKALEGQTNIIEPAVEANKRYFKSLSCPSCGGPVGPIVNARKPFKQGEILPNFLGKCETCGVEFDPATGIQITMPR